MRVTTSKSKNAESFYINFAYIDKNGKSTSKVYKKLGTLKELSKKLNTDRDGVMEWAKEQARLATIEYEKENQDVIVRLSPSLPLKLDEQKSFNIGYLFLQSIYSKLRFDKIFRNIKNKHQFKFDIDLITKHLIFSRILSPSSKLSSYEYSKTFLEGVNYELHDVYRALSVLAQESDKIQSEIYRNTNFIHNRNTKVLYYDCTNYYFEINQEEGFKKYGKSKQHQPHPIVGMGLFIDGDGLPLAFDLFPGNQNEQISLKPLEQKVIRDFDLSEFIFCSDSGLASSKNKKLNNKKGRHYVITQSLKKLKNEDREIVFKTSQYRKVGSSKFIDLKDLDESNLDVYESFYYKEIPLESKGVSEMLVVTYSPKYKAYQQKIRQGQIDRAIKIIDTNEKVKKNRKNPNDPSRFIKTENITPEGEVASIKVSSLDLEAIEEEAKYDGYYAVTTDLEIDVQEIMNINKQRWMIEECFRTMKTEFEANPIFLQREDRITAHFLICFLSLLIYKLLDIMLKNKVTINPLLDTLRDMNVYDLDGQGYIPTYKRTEITDLLHDTFGFNTDRQIIKKAKMKEIIKETKTK